MTLQLGIVLALGSAIASNLAFFYKHRGARAAPAVDVLEFPRFGGHGWAFAESYF